jgi:hypothetical protein
LSTSSISIGDQQRGDQAPDELRIGGKQQRARLQPVLLEAGEHDRRRRRGRQAERQQRHQRAGSRRIVGRFGTGDAFDGAMAELFRVLGQPLFGGVGQEGADFGAAGRHRADREADQRAAQPRLP